MMADHFDLIMNFTHARISARTTNCTFSSAISSSKTPQGHSELPPNASLRQHCFTSAD